ncbi:hypothetical protein [Niabella beijingensis]|uniref:hypothetical protein n=1 Tax=Niabella beijingensis TaxID=2872700 RepID=UPI001CBF6D98|nr:hypothetical protein [Niabella beijingensis]MBZ4187839.1 hypothetical protein [Niabella beijingensis]
MQQKTEMTTLTQVLEKLKQRGIDQEITMNDEKQMVSEKQQRGYQPGELLIIRTFRFEDESDPDNNSILYVTRDQQGNRAFILDIYGPYSNHEGPEFDDFIKKIPMAEREDQELFDSE